jgi:hypothetical protein
MPVLTHHWQALQNRCCSLFLKKPCLQSLVFSLPSLAAVDHWGVYKVETVGGEQVAG